MFVSPIWWGRNKCRSTVLVSLCFSWCQPWKHHSFHILIAFWFICSLGTRSAVMSTAFRATLKSLILLVSVSRHNLKDWNYLYFHATFHECLITNHNSQSYAEVNSHSVNIRKAKHEKNPDDITYWKTTPARLGYIFVVFYTANTMQFLFGRIHCEYACSVQTYLPLCPLIHFCGRGVK